MKEEYTLYKETTRKAEKEFSRTFCLAKWYHANIYFQTGDTHSCYHPASHPIDIKELSQNPSAIHNTSQKKVERLKMLSGQRPEGCKYCWNIEDLGQDLISDRQIRTGNLYLKERVDEIKNNPPDFNVGLDYVEVSFSNICNFKCGYCHPRASSTYANEIKKFGPYTMSHNHRHDLDMTVYEEDNNPFLDAWWKWWPELKKTLKILRITGGEPLIQKSTFKMLDFLEEHPIPDLELNINSNLGSRKEIVDNFCQRINRLLSENKIKKFKLFSSIDTWGNQAEYIRTGLSLEIFENNINRYLEQINAPLTFMITFNVFSVVGFEKLLRKILEWRKQFPARTAREQRVLFDISYLKEPLQFDIQLLPKEEYLKYMQSHLQFMKNNVDDADSSKFTYMEYQKLHRISEYMAKTNYPDKKVKEGRSDFFSFFSEYDKRRNLNFLETFPEMKEFWTLCQKIYEKDPKKGVPSDHL